MYYTKREAEIFLRKHIDDDGAFAVRPSPTSPSDFVISVVRQGEVWHDNLSGTRAGYTLDGRTFFGEIGDLIHHYCEYPYCSVMNATYQLKPPKVKPITELDHH